jgi:bacillithiol biosynthesis deacetylase BshB1
MARILVVGPHPDDQELGMGGSIARLVRQGHDVLLLDMTNGEPTPHGTPSIRKREATAAAKVLGVNRPRLLLGLKNREVVHTLAARHAVAAVMRRHQAEIVFLPYFDDAHPDHVAVTRIVEDARFDAKLTKSRIPGSPIYPKWLIYYFCTHLRQPIVPSFCIDISGEVEIKDRALRAYFSQFGVNPRGATVLKWLRELNGYMGSRIGSEYAEPFFLREPLGLQSLAGLLL